MSHYVPWLVCMPRVSARRPLHCPLFPVAEPSSTNGCSGCALISRLRLAGVCPLPCCSPQLPFRVRVGRQAVAARTPSPSPRWNTQLQVFFWVTGIVSCERWELRARDEIGAVARWCGGSWFREGEGNTAGAAKGVALSVPCSQPPPGPRWIWQWRYRSLCFSGRAVGTDLPVIGPLS